MKKKPQIRFVTVDELLKRHTFTPEEEKELREIANAKPKQS